MAENQNSDPSAAALMKLANRRKKFMIGSDVDKETVFDFPFLFNAETVSYIQDHGKIMFLIRGPPSTCKATLSEMITEKYPDAVFCCADHYFRNSFHSSPRTKDSLQQSHDYCEKKAKTACEKNEKLIIVQNTHMRKWEIQPYLNLAASYNYTVIMAITVYRFDVTPAALFANNPDGLNITYFQKRLQQWEDIPPVLTGWFLSPEDSSYLRNAALDCLKGLTGDGKFCRIFDIYDADEAVKYFKARRLLCCIAGHATDSYEMKDYYLSPIVRYLYGKCFTITILGYLVSLSGMNAVVHVDDKMALLIFEGCHNYKRKIDFSDFMQTLGINNNLEEYSKTIEFKEELASNQPTSVTLEEWEEGESFSASRCSFIPVAQKDDDVFNIKELKEEFKNAILEVASADDQVTTDCFTELDAGLKICRVQESEWLIKAPKKIKVKTIFTGMYV